MDGRFMRKRNKCCICGQEYEGTDFECDVCGWVNNGIEHLIYGETEIDDCNKISRADAKRRYQQGFDTLGRPIKKK